MHILWLVINNCLSWISWKGRTTNDFLINLYESYAAKLGFELAIPGSAVRHAIDWNMQPGNITENNMAKYKNCYFKYVYDFFFIIIVNWDSQLAFYVNLDGPMTAQYRFT